MFRMLTNEDDWVALSYDQNFRFSDNSACGCPWMAMCTRGGQQARGEGKKEGKKIADQKSADCGDLTGGLLSSPDRMAESGI